METLLIVEDEKMIRQGIAAMVKRTGISIANVLECKNGIEALAIAESRKVDVVFTDIRMPKMDGIALVEHLRARKDCPKIVVISGYDDFNYAVAVMKNGVQHYLLKPVKRDHVKEILSKLEEELEQEQKIAEDAERIFRHRMKDFLRGELLHEGEREALRQEFEVRFGKIPYRIAVGAVPVGVPEGRAESGDGKVTLYLRLPEPVLFASDREAVLQMVSDTGAGANAFTVGVSLLHEAFEECTEAYAEAYAARAEAFVTGLSMTEYRTNRPEHQLGSMECHAASVHAEELTDRFLQQFYSEKWEEAVKSLHNLYFQGRHGQQPAAVVLAVTHGILEGLQEDCEDLLGEELFCQEVLPRPLVSSDAGKFLAYMDDWLRRLKSELTTAIPRDKNQDRIKQAIAYIRENYSRDLNMAMVSNYVSMNYSLFSIAFKEVTGINFVNYLKNIRITQAKKLLEETDEKILEISKMVGYDNEKHFMKTFRQTCGISPSEYRKNKEWL